MLQSKEKNFVSCVIYLHDEGERIREFLGLVCGVMRENFEKYEIVCVDDGCVDDTVEQVRGFLEELAEKPCRREGLNMRLPRRIRLLTTRLIQ